MLYLSDLSDLYDRQTDSLWPQIEGAAVAGQSSFHQGTRILR